jgi:formylglycine-generating enzyme required for sulfatase activity
MKHTLVSMSLCLLVALILIGAQAEVTVAESATPAPTPLATPGPTPQTQVRQADGAAMLYVPEGRFTMGSSDGDEWAWQEEKPQHEVYLDAFWIDRMEVTNGQYDECMQSAICTQPRYWKDNTSNQHGQPVVGVDWEQGRAYCEWAGARLPTEAEWEKAARGTDGRRYPWGNKDASCQYAVMDDGGSGCGQGWCPWTVGSKPSGASPYGALDMAGNVWEWVADWYASDYYAQSPARNPQGPESGTRRVIRGGSWYSVPSLGVLRTTERHYYSTIGWDQIGFRCAAPASSTPEPIPTSADATPPAISTPEPRKPTATPMPPTQAPPRADTPVSPPTSTPERVTGVVLAEALNVRLGPGADYDMVGQVYRDDVVQVRGQNAAGDWLSIANEELAGWISARYVRIIGDVAVLPVQTNTPAVPSATDTLVPPATTDTPAPKSNGAQAGAGEIIVNVPLLLGSSVSEVQAQFGAPIEITPADVGSLASIPGGGETRTYRTGVYGFYVDFDRAGAARGFQIIEGLQEQGYKLEQWGSILMRFGFSPSLPDVEAPIALHWNDFEGYHISVFANAEQGVAGSVWSVSIYQVQ